ncbi:uncharacterized protein LOC120679494 [Panicum virgatum]|uniref:uncharacterized protein LOC120679494 n=1 Tax=Panicum virgatum TaxID=38727 RepID=UPI0019D66437|nr:uncharacterized protein LOC120679494 [Panicum virgatum]
MEFPKYTFSLTPIEILPQFAKNKERFLDVLGKITAVSNPAVVRNTARDLMMTRIIKLQDLSLPVDATAVEKIDLPNEDQTHVAFEEKNLLQLNDIDPFTQKGERYQCTVTIIGILDKQHWCYRACRTCSSKMISTSDGFQCTKDGG